MQLEDFNNLPKDEAAKALITCCGSEKWTSLLLEQMPFTSEQSLVAKATGAWYGECSEKEWLEAFTHHPKIGDVKSLEEKFASTKHMAGAEQAGVSSAGQDVIEALAKANADYEEKFGFIFIVCATGKSASEMLRLLKDRLQNSYAEELIIAAGEQHKITLIRLKKLITGSDWSWMKPSQLTTHVLDTSIGKPGKDITIKLQEQHNGSTWQTIAQGVTNSDGRIPNLLPSEKPLVHGSYKMVFDTGGYFASMNIKGFYPEVEIQFTVFDDQHYHVPLLINPFGYSTYRGS